MLRELKFLHLIQPRIHFVNNNMEDL